MAEYFPPKSFMAGYSDSTFFYVSSTSTTVSPTRIKTNSPNDDGII